jgi:transposase
MLEDRFPRIWVPSPENRDVRQLLWHRHRLVQMRTRIMNLLQALAMNEGRRWKSKLWSDQGRAELEKLALAPWASRRRHELLELLDRMNPTIEEFPSLGISLAVVVGFSRHSGSRASLTGKLGAVCLGH